MFQACAEACTGNPAPDMSKPDFYFAKMFLNNLELVFLELLNI